MASFAALALAIAASMPQDACTASSTTDWTRPASDAATATDTVPLWLAFRVPADTRGEAITRLRDVSFVRLSRSAATRFSGDRLLVETRRADGTPFVKDWFRGRAPYLVRAIFPAARPNISVAWHGDRLVVSAYAMGCAPFLNEPLLVWLDHAPDSVLPSASADL